jgi:hypothetical protein
MSSQREDLDPSVGTGQALDVFGVARRDDSSVEFHGGCNDECIDGMTRRELGLGEQSTSALCGLTREFANADASIVQEVVDGCVETRPAADLSQDRSWNAN